MCINLRNFADIFRILCACSCSSRCQDIINIPDHRLEWFVRWKGLSYLNNIFFFCLSSALLSLFLYYKPTKKIVCHVFAWTWMWTSKKKKNNRKNWNEFMYAWRAQWTKSLRAGWKRFTHFMESAFSLMTFAERKIYAVIRVLQRDFWRATVFTWHRTWNYMHTSCVSYFHFGHCPFTMHLHFLKHIFLLISIWQDFSALSHWIQCREMVGCSGKWKA